MNLERRVSGQFVSWIFGTAKGGPVAATLRKAGLDLEHLESEYPAEALPGWLSLLSSSLHPTLAPGEALRRVGFESVRGLTPGSSLERVMDVLPSRLESAGNFFDVSVRSVAPHRYVAHFDDVAALPTFFLGVLQGVASSSTTGPAEVTWSPAGLSGARYVVTSTK